MFTAEQCDREMDLSFDINSVQSRVLALIPGITDEEVEGFVQSRDHRPFVDFADFEKRGTLRAKNLAQFKKSDLDQNSAE